MNADFVLFFGGVEFEVFVQGCAGAEGKRLLARDAYAGMALGTEIDQSLRFEPAGVQDVRHIVCIGMGALIGCVVCARTVAPLAGDAKDKVIPVVGVARIGCGFKIGGVALQAAGDNRTGEVHLAVGVARAVDPPSLLGEVGDGQLVEAVALPEEVGLTDFSGAGHDVDALGPSVGALPFPDNGRLKEPIVSGGYLEPEVGLPGSEDGVFGREAAQDCLGIGQAGGEVVRCLAKRFKSVPVTLPAGLSANVGRWPSFAYCVPAVGSGSCG